MQQDLFPVQKNFKQIPVELDVFSPKLMCQINWIFLLLPDYPVNFGQKHFDNFSFLLFLFWDR